MDTRKPSIPPSTSAASAENSSVQNTETPKKTFAEVMRSMNPPVPKSGTEESQSPKRPLPEIIQPQNQKPEGLLEIKQTQDPKKLLSGVIKSKNNSLTDEKISPTSSKSNLQAIHPRKSPGNLNAVFSSESQSTFTVLKSRVHPRERLESYNSIDIPPTKVDTSTNKNVEQEEIRNDFPMPLNQAILDESIPIMKDHSTCFEQVKQVHNNKPEDSNSTLTKVNENKAEEFVNILPNVNINKSEDSDSTLPKVNKNKPEDSECIIPKVNVNMPEESDSILPKVNENKPEEFVNILPNVNKNKHDEFVSMLSNVNKNKNEDSVEHIDYLKPKIIQVETQTDKTYNNQRNNPEKYHADTSYFTETEIDEIVNIFCGDENTIQQTEIKPENIYNNFTFLADASTSQGSLLNNKTSSSMKLSLPDTAPFYNQCDDSTCKVASITEKAFRSKKLPFSNKSSVLNEASNPNRLQIPNKTPMSNRSEVCSLFNNAPASKISSNFTGSLLPDKVSTVTLPKNKTGNHKPLTFSKILQGFDEETQESIEGSSTSTVSSGSTTNPRFTELESNWCNQLDTDNEAEISEIVNLLQSGSCNILDDTLNLQDDDSSPKVDHNKPKTPLGSPTVQKLSASFKNLTTKSPFPTSEHLRSLEKIITGIAFQKLPESISKNIPEAINREHPQPKDIDFGAAINVNKRRNPPCMTESEAHMYMSGDFSGYFNFNGYSSKNTEPQDPPLPHIATQTIDRLEKLLEMTLTFGFKITDDLVDQFGNQILAPPVNNSISQIRDALKPMKSYLESAENITFFRPFMNTVNNAITPAFHHLNDMRLTMQSPRTYENYTDLKYERKETDERDNNINFLSLIQQINNEIYENVENQTNVRPFAPNQMSSYFPFMPNNTFQNFPMGHFGFNPNELLMSSHPNVENVMTELGNQNQQPMAFMSNTEMLYHNPSQKFNTARVIPLGLIEFQFKYDLRVVLTADLSVIVINKTDKVVAALSSDGHMAGFKFLHGECCLEGQTINIATTNTKFVVDKRAKIWEKGISFQGEKSPMTYVLTEAGIATSIFIFPSLPSDFLGQIFYRSGKYGPSYIQTCLELLTSSKHEIRADGSSYWFIRNMKIFQNAEGQVAVHKENFTYNIYMTPQHLTKSKLNKDLLVYSARMKVPNMMITCSTNVTTDSQNYYHNFFIKQGHKKEIFTNNSKFAVRNGSQVAELNVETHKIQLNSKNSNIVMQ